MAYQNVGTPRFYVDNHLFLSANGVTPTNVGEIYNLSPGSHSVSFDILDWYYFAADTGGESNAGLVYGYIAVFGHNFADLGDTFRFYPDPGIPVINITNTVNYHQQGSMSYNGWSLIAFDKTDVEATIWAGLLPAPDDPLNLKISSLSIGTHYTMPHSPDLNLTMTREYGGIKTIETKGGASLSNAFYTKPAMWGDAGAWELYSGTPTNQELSRSGRRVWDLSFSYLQDSDVWGANQMMSSFSEYTTKGNINIGYESGDVDGANNLFDDNILTSDDFYSQVIHKTNGGQLPFIFQPDKNDNNPGSGFAICKFDMKSFKFDQVANGVYNVKLKIREVC